MLSRVADAIFWMNRYIERAENVARFIDVNQRLTLGFFRGFETHWEPLIHSTGDDKLYHKLYDSYDHNNVIRFLTFDKENPNSILSCLNMARENARRVRDNLSLAIWEAINRFYLRVNEVRDSQMIIENPHQFLDLVKEQSQLIIGASETTLSHGDAWNIARLGRLIERADKTSRILDVKYYILLPSAGDVGGNLDVVQWTALLNSTSALQMYRRRHGRIDPKKVVEFLVLDREFPRSLHFCLNRADIALHRISGSDPSAYCNRAEQLMGLMKSRMDFTSVDDVVNQGLHEYIDAFQIQLNEIGAEIHAAFSGNHSQQQYQAMYR